LVRGVPVEEENKHRNTPKYASINSINSIDGNKQNKHGKWSINRDLNASSGHKSVKHDALGVVGKYFLRSADRDGMEVLHH
jgi:hypothetical protein